MGRSVQVIWNLAAFYRGVLSYQNDCMCLHVTCALKHNTRMINLYYRTSAVSKDLNNAYWGTLIVKLYSVTKNNRNTECDSFDRTPRSMCGQVSNNEHTTSHDLTRLNVEFEDLIAACNRLYCFWFCWVLGHSLSFMLRLCLLMVSVQDHLCADVASLWIQVMRMWHSTKVIEWVMLRMWYSYN